MSRMLFGLWCKRLKTIVLLYASRRQRLVDYSKVRNSLVTVATEVISLVYDQHQHLGIIRCCILPEAQCRMYKHHPPLWVKHRPPSAPTTVEAKQEVLALSLPSIRRLKQLTLRSCKDLPQHLHAKVLHPQQQHRL